MAIATTFLTERVTPLHTLRAYLTLYGALLLVGTSMILVTSTVMPFVALSRPLVRRRRAQAVISGLFRIQTAMLCRLGAFEVDLAEVDRLVACGPRVVVANHPSLVDAMLIVSRLPASVCVMKSQVSRNPLLGLGSWLAGYIRNDSPVQLVRRSVQALREGSQLVVFPEGTRTRRVPMDEMRGAFATIARQAGCPVVLLAIESDSRFGSKGWPLWRLPTFPLRYRIRVIGELLPDLDRDEMVARTRAAYQREFPPSATFASGRESVAHS